MATLLLLWITQPRFYADTMNYALNIMQHSRGQIAPGADPLWDFGHVLWRPLGYVIWVALNGPHSSDPLTLAAHVLATLSLAAAVAAIFLTYFLASNYTGKAWVGAVTAIGLLVTHAVLNYAKTGTSYIPGLTCQIANLYWIERRLRQGRGNEVSTWLVSGFLLGVSVAFWFPYCLTVPAALALAYFYDSKAAGRFTFVARIAIVCALSVTVVYAVAIWADQIQTLSAAHNWYERSQYGKSQTKGYLRVITGVPRGFFWLGNDGWLWKRFLLRRQNTGLPPVSLFQLVTQSLWKLLAVYLALAAVGWKLARSKGRLLLGVLVLAAVPVFIFAILFEAGPPERYLPVFPILFLAFAYVLGRSERRRQAAAAVLILFGLMLVCNLAALNRAGTDARWAVTTAKVKALSERSSPEDLVLLVTFQDDVLRMLEERPFAPINRQIPHVQVVVELLSQSTLTWRKDAAEVILRRWQGERRVWISKRLLALSPKIDWNWVEGDDERVHWTDFPSFFRPLLASPPDSSDECCGPDGYVLIQQTPENIDYLERQSTNRTRTSNVN